MSQTKPIHIIGGGLAGSEAAWQVAERGVPVVLHEMRPVRRRKHIRQSVWRSSFAPTPSGPTMGEQRRRAAARGDAPLRLARDAAGDAHKLPAGGALAVDRDGFLDAVTEALASIRSSPSIAKRSADCRRRSGTASSSPRDPSPRPRSAEAILKLTGETSLAFFDAIAPVIHRRLDRLRAAPGCNRATTRLGRAARRRLPQLPHGSYRSTRRSSTPCSPATRPSFKEWEASTPYFDGCLPIEVMAERGRDTLRFGPMKPVGLTDPHKAGARPYAVVQLRQDNALGTLWNMVGFQTKLKHAEQVRDLPHDTGARKRRVRAPRRSPSQYVPELAEASRSRAAAEGRAASALCRSDHRGRRLCRKCCHRALGRPVRGSRAAWRGDPSPATTTALGALIGHITGGHLLVEEDAGRTGSFQP